MLALKGLLRPLGVRVGGLGLEASVKAAEGDGVALGDGQVEEFADQRVGPE